MPHKKWGGLLFQACPAKLPAPPPCHNATEDSARIALPCSKNDKTKNRDCGNCTSAMDNLDIIGVIALPFKTDAPLLVNPDAMLTLSVKMQLLQIIGRWNSQGSRSLTAFSIFSLIATVR